MDFEFEVAEQGARVLLFDHTVSAPPRLGPRERPRTGSIRVLVIHEGRTGEIYVIPPGGDMQGGKNLFYIDFWVPGGIEMDPGRKITPRRAKRLKTDVYVSESSLGCCFGEKVVRFAYP